MADGEPRRARDLQEFSAKMTRLFVPDEAAASIAALEPRPSDVIISPFGKCGTTWLQQTFHTLRTRGDMDFDDISEVVPWIETARLLDIDINAEQRANPRGFKSHLAFHEVPKGARYIVSLRNPKDALVSMFHFMQGWFIEPGTIPIGMFSIAWLIGGAGGTDYWQHLKSWWAERDNPDVLLLTYEQMIADPAGHIRRIAEFCDIPLDEELLALTLERSSLAYMLGHKEKFADPMIRRVSELRCDLPPDSDSSKVRKGGAGGHKTELPPEVGAILDKLWAERIEPEIGLADYEALDAALKEQRMAVA